MASGLMDESHLINVFPHRENPSPIAVDTRSINKGYRQCQKIARTAFADWIWTIRNLPAQEHRAVCSLLVHLHIGLNYCEQRHPESVNQDLISGWRDSLSDALDGKPGTCELVALAETVRSYQIPCSFLFEFIEAVDWLMRFPAPGTWEDCKSVAAKSGGSMVAAAACIFRDGRVMDDYTAALRLGQALMLTMWINRATRDARLQVQRLPDADFGESEILPVDLGHRPPAKQLAWFARLQAHHVEQLLIDAKPLLNQLDYDGQRVAKTLTEIAWQASMKLRSEPARLVSDEGLLNRSEIGRLRRRHFLGLAPELPFTIPDSSHH